MVCLQRGCDSCAGICRANVLLLYGRVQTTFYYPGNLVYDLTGGLGVDSFYFARAGAGYYMPSLRKACAGRLCIISRSGVRTQHNCCPIHRRIALGFSSGSSFPGHDLPGPFAKNGRQFEDL
jgi:hypothetical protein